MRRILFALCLFAPVVALPAVSQPASTAANAAWMAQVTKMMPLLGHRNWILIVDSAYPLQLSPGVEVVETNADQLDVLRFVLQSIAASRHVRPVITMDAELPYVPDSEAPGATKYRIQSSLLLHGYTVAAQPHATLLAEIDEAGKQYKVLVLKTTMTVPYSSVFIRLDCKYWSDENETRLRARMASAAAAPKSDQ
jgi:hypothetical protein